MYIDLTMKVEENMIAFPGDPTLKIKSRTSIAENGFASSEITMSSHAGTHVDMPAHIIDGGAKEADLTKLIGVAGILDVRGEYMIEYNPAYGDAIEKDDIVILYTGASEGEIDESYYTRYIKLEQELIDFFIDRGIKMLCIDCASIEPFGELDVHRQFLEAGIPIVENLTNLSSIPDGEYLYELFVMPLKMECDGLPARVILNAVEG